MREDSRHCAASHRDTRARGPRGCLPARASSFHDTRVFLLRRFGRRCLRRRRLGLRCRLGCRRGLRCRSRLRGRRRGRGLGCPADDAIEEAWLTPFAVVSLALNHDKNGRNNNQDQKNSHAGALPVCAAVNYTKQSQTKRPGAIDFARIFTLLSLGASRSRAYMIGRSRLRKAPFPAKSWGWA